MTSANFQLLSIEGNTGLAKQLASGCWSSTYERDFYEKIPELKSILPKVCFQESEKATIEIKDVDITNIDVDNIDVTASAEDESGAEQATTANEDAEMEEGFLRRNLFHLSEIDDELPDIEERGIDYDSMTHTQRMDFFVKALPTKHSRQLIDQAAEEFVKYMNETRNRNRLVKTIFEV